MQKPKLKTSKKAAHGIMNLGLLVTVLSIAYTTYVVVAGTEGITPKVLTAPQALFAAAVLIKQFIRN